MANSVDPNQTAPLETLVYEILGHFPYSNDHLLKGQ